jgi:hypothetical protein
VGLNTLKSLNLTNVYPNNNNNNKVKSKPLELRSRVKNLIFDYFESWILDQSFNFGYIPPPKLNRLLKVFLKIRNFN